MKFKTTDIGEFPLTEKEEAELEIMGNNFNIEQDKLAKTQYQRDRAAAYPAAAEYLDGIVKGDQAQIQAYIDACIAVKVKYPKP